RSVPVRRAMVISLLVAIIMIGYYFASTQIDSIQEIFNLLIILTVVTFTYFYFILDKVKIEKQKQILFFKIIHSVFIIWNVYFIVVHLRYLRYMDEWSGLTSSQFLQHAILYFFMIIYLYT